MKFALVAVSLLLSIASSARAEEWVTYASPDGKFQALFPAKPVETSQSTETEFGSVQFTSCMAEIANGSVAYGVTYNDYPDSVRKTNPEKVLDSAREGVKNNLKGTVVAETKSIVNDYPARDFTVESEVDGQKLFYHTRLVLVESRLYQLLIVRVGDTPVDIADGVRFFANFKPLTK